MANAGDVLEMEPLGCRGAADQDGGGDERRAGRVRRARAAARLPRAVPRPHRAGRALRRHGRHAEDRRAGPRAPARPGRDDGGPAPARRTARCPATSRPTATCASRCARRAARRPSSSAWPRMCAAGDFNRFGFPKPVAGAGSSPSSATRATPRGRRCASSRRSSRLVLRAAGLMRPYVFVDEWDVAAPPEAVFAAIADARTYPEWWRPVYLDVDADGPAELGKESRQHFKGRLPYHLHTRSRVVALDAPRTVTADVDGDLRGRGTWTLTPDRDRHPRALRLAGPRRPPAAAGAHAGPAPGLPLEPQLGHRAGDGGPRALRAPDRLTGAAPAPTSAYIASIVSAYLASIGLRLSFIVGVSSSPPGSQSPSTIVNFLICSTRASLVLAASTPSCTAARISSLRASASSDGVLDAVLGRPGGREVGVEDDQRRVVGAPVADAGRLADERARGLERGLDVGRRHVLAGGVDDDLLLAVDDLQVAVLVELADVAGAQEAVLGHRLGGLLRLVAVAEHHHVAADEQLAVVGQLHLDAGRRRPDGADLDPLGRVGRARRRTSRSSPTARPAAARWRGRTRAPRPASAPRRRGSP